MAFFFDFRLVTDREILLKVLGIGEVHLSATLDFDPTAFRQQKTLDEKEISILEIPVFIRHDIPKKGKGSGVRTVWEPLILSSVYKTLARRLEHFFRSTLEGYPHPDAYGYRPGRNTRENAFVHVGNKYLFSTDIESFFPSISTTRVRDLLVLTGINPETSDLLARFVTIQDALPLGLPTSPVISNAIALPLDKSLSEFALKNGLKYSRYSDDMSFSSNNPIQGSDKIEELVEQHQFSIARRKNRLSTRGQAHFVTGLSISDKNQPHVPRKMKARLRQELYFSKKYGLLDHFKRINVTDKSEIQERVNRLDGLVKYVAHHEPRLSALLNEAWTNILNEDGLRPSFAPRGINNAPFFLFIDEAELNCPTGKLLALGFCVTQHPQTIADETRVLLSSVMSDGWYDGDRQTIEKKGMHFNDTTEDLRLKFVQAMERMPFEGFVAYSSFEPNSNYEGNYLRILSSLIERRLMAAESQKAFLVFEENSKVSKKAVEQCVQEAFERLKYSNNRRPIAIHVSFVSKPNFMISIPDFLLGVLSKYLRSIPTKNGRSPRDEVMFERLRDKYRLIIDLDAPREYSRRIPIKPWSCGSVPT